MIRIFGVLALTFSSGKTLAAPKGDASNPWIIHAIGDSITNGIHNGGAYRPELYRLLKQRGIHATFVGDLESGPADFDQRRHNGHDGWVIQQIRDEIDGCLEKHRPEVVLLMIGINDIETGSTVAAASARLGKLIDRITADRPRALVFVSELTVINEPGADRLAQEFNARLPELIRARRDRAGGVRLVPMHDAFGIEDLADYDHPLPSGNQKMAKRWFDFVAPALEKAGQADASSEARSAVHSRSHVKAKLRGRPPSA